MLDLDDKSKKSSMVIRFFKSQLKKLKKKLGLSTEEALVIFLDSLEKNENFKVDLSDFNVFKKWCQANLKRFD